MLSDEEKREMLEDGKSRSRRDDFRFVRKGSADTISFDSYLRFLNSAQKVFSPFKPTRHIAVTRLNKL